MEGGAHDVMWTCGPRVVAGARCRAESSCCFVIPSNIAALVQDELTHPVAHPATHPRVLAFQPCDPGVPTHPLLADALAII